MEFTDSMARLATHKNMTPPGSVDCGVVEVHGKSSVEGKEALYWLTPVSSVEDGTAENVIEALVGQEKIYAFGERTPGRKRVKPGDYIAFYASGKGVVAHARIASLPERKNNPLIRNSEMYPWVFKLRDPKLYLMDPVVIDASLRSKLDAFKGKDMSKPWAWLVHSTSQITKKDYEMLTRK